MNRKKIFIVSSILFLILTAVLIIKPNKPDATNNDKEPTKIISENPDDLNTITLIEEENYVYRKVDGVWVTDLSDKLKIDQNLFNSYATKLSSLKPIMVIAENATAEQKKEYGLDHEIYIGLKYKNGNEYSIAIGNSSPASNGEYVILKGSDTIYLVSSEDLFLFYMFPNQYIYKDINPKPDFRNLTQIKLSYPNNIIYDIEKTGEKLYHMKSPIDFDLDYNKISKSLISYLEKLEFYSYEETKTNDDTDKYGFENPTLNISLKDSNDVTLNLTVGNKLGDYGYYATFNDSPDVFSILNETVQPLIDLQVSSLINNIISSYDFLTIKNLYVDYKDKKYNYDITIYNGQLMDGLLNGEKLFSTKLQFALEKIQSLSVDLINDSYNDVSLDKPVLYVKYTLDDGSIFEDTYYDYDEEYYIVYKNGKKYGLVSKNQVEILFNTINANS